MYPAEFDYVAPETLEEALGVLAEDPEARPLAGGQSLIPLLKLRLTEVKRLVDLRKIEGLRYVREEGDEIAIGALTPHAEVAASDRLTGAGRALAEAAASVGDPQVRNVGTLGGSLAHADPAADLPAAAVALDATLVTRGVEGERRVPAEEFFQGLWTTALEPGELLVEVRIPAGGGGNGSGGRGAYEKLAHRASGFAVVGVAAAVEVDEGRFGRVRVGLTGVGNRPVRLGDVEEVLAGGEVAEGVVAEACAGAGAAVEFPQDDLQGSGEYRRAMTDVYARRAIWRAATAG